MENFQTEIKKLSKISRVEQKSDGPGSIESSGYDPVFDVEETLEDSFSSKTLVKVQKDDDKSSNNAEKTEENTSQNSKDETTTVNSSVKSTLPPINKNGDKANILPNDDIDPTVMNNTNSSDVEVAPEPPGTEIVPKTKKKNILI